MDREIRDRDEGLLVVRIGNVGEGTNRQVGGLLCARRSVLEGSGGFNHRLDLGKPYEAAVYDGIADQLTLGWRTGPHGMDQWQRRLALGEVVAGAFLPSSSGQASKSKASSTS